MKYIKLQSWGDISCTVLAEAGFLCDKAPMTILLMLEISDMLCSSTVEVFSSDNVPCLDEQNVWLAWWPVSLCLETSEPVSEMSCMGAIQ